MPTDAHVYRLIKNVLVPLRDGVRLAARLFLPDGPDPFPAIVNLMPYYKDGAYSVGYLDAVNRYFAARGYAMITADLRGVGNSEGVAPYAFSAQERADGYDLVEWAAVQPWSSGAVGMWGLSYGGITSLATASANPPSLRAIVAIHAAADAYGDYLHANGCRVAFSPDVHWGIRMAANNLVPPLYHDPDGRWAALWRERLETYRPWIVGWHERSSYDDFWQANATATREIRVPTYLVNGWRDLFAAVNLRMFEELGAPKRLLVGPWKHVFPDLGKQAPIGFLPEMARWWDRWLKDEPNGIDQEPPIVHYVYGADEWRFEKQWPPAHSRHQALGTAGPGELAEAADDWAPIRYEYDPRAGASTVAMHWLPGPDFPPDATGDDAVSLCFDGAPLPAATEIVGTPAVVLRLSATIPEPPLVARLADVAPDGRAQIITFGWMKGRGQAPGTAENRLQPGEVAEIWLPLRPISYRLEAGHRLRLSLSCADLTRIWPESRHFSLDLHAARLELPLVDGPDPALPTPRLERPEMQPSPRVTTRAPSLQLRHDLLQPVVRLEAATGQVYQLDDDVTLESDCDGTLTVDAARPWLSNLLASASFTVRRSSGTVRTAAKMVETADQLHVAVEVMVNGRSIYAREWSTRVDEPSSSAAALAPSDDERGEPGAAPR